MREKIYLYGDDRVDEKPTPHVAYNFVTKKFLSSKIPLMDSERAERWELVLNDDPLNHIKWSVRPFHIWLTLMRLDLEGWGL